MQEANQGLKSKDYTWPSSWHSAESQSLTADPGHWPMVVTGHKPPQPAQLQSSCWGARSGHSAITDSLKSNITHGYGQFTQDAGDLAKELKV